MNTWVEALEEVALLNRAVRPAEAEEQLAKVLTECPFSELRTLDTQVCQAIGTFLPKRRRALESLWKQRQESPESAIASLDRSVQRHADPNEEEELTASSQTGPASIAEGHSIAPSPCAQTEEIRKASTEKQIAEALAAICHLNATVQPALADEKFRQLLASLDEQDLSTHYSELHGSLELFLPKRRRALNELLRETMQVAARRQEARARSAHSQEARGQITQPHSPSKVTPLGEAAPPPTSGASDHGGGLAPSPHLPMVNGSLTQRTSKSPLTYSKDRLSEDLDDLGKRHIFQWATFYRETLSQYFDAFMVELGSSDKPNLWLNLMKAALSHHATETFQKGFHYQLEHNSATPHYAITKSLAGLQRFLDLPLEFYSARLAEANLSGTALNLRRLCSAMVSGVLIGYSHASFDLTGSKILPRFPGSWVHVLPFLTSDDLRELMGNLEPGDLLDGVHDSVLPLVRALDMLLQKDPGAAPLPALSQYSDGSRRLEVSLQLAPKAEGSRRIEVHCYTSPRFVDRLLIEEAAARAVGAVIAPLRADLRIQLLSAERLSDIVVPTGVSSGEEPHTRLVALLEDLVYETRSIQGNRPIDFNYASEFPLESPFLTRYSHVYRTSVRRLMQSFERRNGVRLWCSVRRSGKTTACASDIGSTSSQSVVVTQTCDSTGQIADGDVFYQQVRRALDSGKRLDEDFVSRTVAACLPSRVDTRVVLVLDEYETLFGDLRTSMDRDPGLRYAVVQPLLNQLVAFTRDNLLIFMGQQPNAHWILTDQNQLSPVVMQDPFPLFSHEPSPASSGEFPELVHKVMSSHVKLDPQFVDRVYDETGGHPFLTGKLLVSFWDWLINDQRPASSLAPVHPELFLEFIGSSLDRTSIAHNHHYEMFKRAAADHLSSIGRSKDPWLHSVYSAMRALVLSSPDTFSMTVADFAAVAERDCVGMSPQELLSSATRANFLTFEAGIVRPRIRLLGRIAAAVQPN